MAASSGSSVVKTLAAPANACTIVAVHDSAQGIGLGQVVSASVTTTNPGGIVVERPMYFTYAGGRDGGHNVMGYAPYGEPAM